jgi:glycerol 2-dehydrogenase (NADP+)
MADKYKCDGANILISWLLARDIVTLPKSVTPSRIVANLQRAFFVFGQADPDTEA